MAECSTFEQKFIYFENLSGLFVHEMKGGRNGIYPKEAIV